MPEGNESYVKKMKIQYSFLFARDRLKRMHNELNNLNYFIRISIRLLLLLFFFSTLLFLSIIHNNFNNFRNFSIKFFNSGLDIIYEYVFCDERDITFQPFKFVKDIKINFSNKGV